MCNKSNDLRYCQSKSYANVAWKKSFLYDPVHVTQAERYRAKWDKKTAFLHDTVHTQVKYLVPKSYTSFINFYENIYQDCWCTNTLNIPIFNLNNHLKTYIFHAFRYHSWGGTEIRLAISIYYSLNLYVV